MLVTQTRNPDNLISNGDFETPVVGWQGVRYSAGQEFEGWKVEAGSIDLMGENYWQNASGTQSIDLNGSFDTRPGIFYQDIATEIGQTYRLSFRLAGNPDGAPITKSLRVWWGTSLIDTIAFDGSGRTRQNMGWLSYDYSVVATSSTTRLKFESLSETLFGPVIDNVSLYSSFEYTFFEDFGANGLDTSRWRYRQTGEIPLPEVLSHRLELTIPANTQGGEFGSGIASNCNIRGDLDVQVDFQLLDWPAANGVRVGLNLIKPDGSHIGNMERVSFGLSSDYPGGARENYVAHFFGEPALGHTVTTDTRGKLRLTRIGNVITGYYWNGDQWQAIHSATARLDDASIVLSIWSGDYAFTRRSVRVAFDDVIVHNGAMLCDILPPSALAVSTSQILDSAGNQLYPQGQTHASTVEGNVVTATIHLENLSSEPLQGVVSLNYGLEDQSITIPANGTANVVLSFISDGLAYDSEGRRVRIHGLRAIFQSNRGAIAAAEPVMFAVWPRPVILVHGYNSDPGIWQDYRSSQMLGSTELSDIAIYTAERINTGAQGSPTNTIDQNAQQLAAVVEQARSTQGADQVDIIAHSMGGLISRRYLHVYTETGSVRQLIMLGTPNRGSVSAGLAAAGCLFLSDSAFPDLPCRKPAIDELTVSSVDQFNQLNTNRSGARLYAVAGQYVCTEDFVPFNLYEVPDPDDIVVSTESVFWIGVDRGWRWPTDRPGCQGRHEWLYQIGDARYGGAPIFDNIVRPLLTGQAPTAAPAVAKDASAQLTSAQESVQFTAVQSGTLSAGGRLEFQQVVEPGSDGVFNIGVVGSPGQFTVSLRSPDNQIYTPGSSDPNVRYIQLGANLFPLTGYSLSNVQPGNWTVIIDSTTQTPATGAPIAVLGSLQSNLRLDPQLMGAPVSIGDNTAIAVRLSALGSPVLGATVTGILETPGGATIPITLRDDGQSGDNAAGDGVYGYRLTPRVPGVYSAVLSAAPTTNNPAGRSILWVVNVEGFQIALPLVRR